MTDSSSVDRMRAPNGAPAELTRIQQHVVDLLARLDRHPRSLQIRVGEISLEITWAEYTNRAAETSQPPATVPDIVTHGSEEPPEQGDCLVSPGVGVFYHASEPGAEPFVSVGSVVRAGEQIGIIEAMKLMVPVEADQNGRIVAVLKGNGEPVEYGEPLFRLNTSDSQGGDNVRKGPDR